MAVFSQFNFHTIQSILKLYCSGDASFIGLNFHTIQSILKLEPLKRRHP